jgi:predicted O-linked N-acetylglucosamine transferase (SPINDLY family)
MEMNKDPSEDQQTLTIQQAIDLAVQHHTQGRLPEAEGIYQQILQADPNQPVALHLLGVLAHQTGNNDGAVDLISKALVVNPDFAEAHNNLGTALLELGRTQEAVNSFRKALTLKPDYAKAHNNLGNAQKERGDLDEAVASYHSAIDIEPGNVDALTNLGLVLRDFGKLDESVATFYKVLDIKPDFAEAYINLGSVFQEMGRLVEAEESFHKAITLNPNYVEGHNNLGNVFLAMGRLDKAVESYRKALDIKPDIGGVHYNLGLALQEMERMDEALDSYQKALDINPDYVEAHNNLGNVLQGLGKMDEAVESFRKAIAIYPKYAEAHNNLGIVFKKMGRFDEAVVSFQKSLDAKPDFAEAHNNLGNTYQELRKFEEAIGSCRMALDLKPDSAAIHSNFIFMQDLVSDSDNASQQAERKLWSDTFVSPLVDKIKPHTNSREPKRRLRIGYVSADFRNHSACQAFSSLILNFDREKFDVICYDATPIPDQVTETLRAAATDWREIRGIDDEEVAQTIREDAIDILVDLSGHTNGNRLKIFGFKPAPLQVTGLGHLAPGISTIDFRLTSTLATPPEEEHLYPEKPIYLNTFFSFTEPQGAPLVCPSPQKENGFITFGNLGRITKVSDTAMELWAKILLDVPQSRLLLKYALLDSESFRQRVRRMFSGFGITEDRLIFLGYTQKIEHLKAYNSVDIVLDTFPHGGGMTTMESLWMGVPVVGLVSPEKFVGRIFETICRPLGLEEWVARDIDEYHEIAVQWAGRADELSKIRHELRDWISEVYFRFPRDAEKSYRLIWKGWCDGVAPSPLYPLS